ncbi:hypothetical protein ACWD5R_18115 [Streptomyces sp. NPDC002514]|uniref:hypothetical protein n=1 Tax=Streptomyces sp. NPDC001270 TaxID=3364554 RepID=UPI0036C298A4
MSEYNQYAGQPYGQYEWDVPLEWPRSPYPESAGPALPHETPEQSSHEQRNTYNPTSVAQHAPYSSYTPERAYHAWKETQPDLRPAPTWWVIAGHAGRRRPRHLTRGHLRAFEVSEGIPSGTLEYVRGKDKRPAGVQVAKGATWTPGAYQAPADLDSQTLAVTAYINMKSTSQTEAYRQWDNLPPHLRPAPNEKVIQGYKEKKWGLTYRDLDDFALAKNIPREDMIVHKDSTRHIKSIEMKQWPPLNTFYTAPSQQDVYPVPVLGTAEYSMPQGEGRHIPSSPSQQAGPPSPSATGWGHFGSGSGTRHGPRR